MMPPMDERGQQGQANLTAILVLLDLIVGAVWVWKRLSPDTQDYLVEHTIPLALLSLLAVGVLGWITRKVLEHRRRCRRRERLIARFQRETSPGKRLDLAFELIEMNRYRLEGLEPVASALVDLFLSTLKTAVGDKQHRIRGMAASYVGVLQDKRATPFLLKALEDDHAYVRACAALGLGRMRASEAKAKLAYVMEEDWDQTVRSRAREALERIV
ncbi:MAG: hypothetical protein C4293_09925 [Nitrospiraceae bacterium]